MTRAEHTPGPWATTPNGGVHAGTVTVALATQGNADERAADARLIAAAPELLTVLEYARDGVRRVAAAMPAGERGRADLLALGMVLERAVDKATREDAS